ncbi:helix-turn-helix domain-containing protein [Streptomyces sp. NPDC003554]
MLDVRAPQSAFLINDRSRPRWPSYSRRSLIIEIEVCSRSGVDLASYSRIEQGHASPKLDTLIRIADAIGVDLAELVR